MSISYWKLILAIAYAGIAVWMLYVGFYGPAVALAFGGGIWFAKALSDDDVFETMSNVCSDAIDLSERAIKDNDLLLTLNKELIDELRKVKGLK